MGFNSKKEIQIIIKAVDQATKNLTGIGDAMKGLGIVSVAVGTVVASAFAAAGVAAYNLAKDAAEVEKVENTWNNLAKSLGEQEGDIQSLRKASRGMVKDYDLMRGASKLMSMGLADSNDQAATMVEMATQLGMAMGYDATQSVEDFALMLANQSIPRLDTFGISSSVVRTRIEELMAADQNLTREQAFMNAVMEQGAVTMGKVGEQGTGAAADMARLQANIDNLKANIGERFLPVLATVSEKLVEAWNKPEVQEFINNELLPAIDSVVGDEESGIIGVVTALSEGDIGGALKAAFGDEIAADILGVADAISSVSTWLSDLNESLPESSIDFENFGDSVLLAFDNVHITVDDAKKFFKEFAEAVPKYLQIVGWAYDVLALSMDVIASNIELSFANMVNNTILNLLDLKIGVHNIMVDIANEINAILGTNISIPDIKIPQGAIGAGLKLSQIMAELAAAKTALGVVTENPLVEGFQSGGSFIVPGSAAGDRPYILGLESGEQVDVTPRGQVSRGGATSPINLTININTPINLADRNFVEQELYPYIETGMRRLLAGA